MGKRWWTVLVIGGAGLVAACSAGHGGGDGAGPAGGDSAYPAGGYTQRRACATPGVDWEQKAPAELGMDEAKLQEALDWANEHLGLSVAVYRHGCLLAQSRLDTLTAEHAFDGWSMTKSVTALLVGRAVTLGLLDLDAPIGRLYPEADAAHARLTLRQLMSETAGMHVNYVRELDPLMPDRVQDALTLPFDHEPGEVWAYAQTVVDLVLNNVERAAGMDVQAFAQQQLFDPLGIAPGSWSWERDLAGNTQGWAHLKLRNQDWAKLGQLVLWNGRWNDRVLVSPAYLREMLRRVPDNPAYGLLTWINGGRFWRVPAVEGPDGGEGSVIPAGPPDLFAYVGIGEQRSWMIPSRGLVIVRLGERGSQEPDTRVAVFSGRAGQIDWEIPRRVLLAVTDQPYADPGPYESAGLVLPPVDDGIVGDAFELQHVLAGLGFDAAQVCALVPCSP